MAFVLALATATLLVQPVCSWDRPGVDRYRGTPAAALAHYRDISAADRAVLAQRIATGLHDDTVKISRTAIAGQYQYDRKIADMHFGTRRMCRTVTRAGWKPAHQESGAVYCVNDECVLVPQVCGNVSRIRKMVTSGADSPGTTGGSLPRPQESPPEQPAPVYLTVPSGNEAMPPWVEAGAPSSPIPILDNPGPGRGVTGPMPLAPVPEPSTWAMLLGGATMLAAYERWRRLRGRRP